MKNSQWTDVYDQYSQINQKYAHGMGGCGIILSGTLPSTLAFGDKLPTAIVLDDIAGAYTCTYIETMWHNRRPTELL